MKAIALTALLVLFSTPVLAQSLTPTTQQGSNQRAGGPANSLISETGGTPKPVERSLVPPTQNGTSRAGGPANELNSMTGGAPRR